jgi:hypothetical protein
MRRVRKTIVLAFAAFGVYRAWELLGPKLGATEPVEDGSFDVTPSLGSTSRESVSSVATAAAVDSTREEGDASGASEQAGAPSGG